MSEKLVEVRGLWKAYRPKMWVLQGIDFDVGKGEFVVIVGPNGSGKTTFLKILAGLLRPTRGTVRICGYEPWSLRAKRCRGVVMHWSFLYDELTVRENLSFYSSLAGLEGYNAARDPVARRLGLHERLGQLAAWLSFGWRKRTDIARAMLGNPPLLLLDEPLTGLDRSAGSVLISILREYVGLGGSIVAATPKGEEELIAAASKVYEIVDGRLVEAKG
ncbi:ABC transporter ATP-binding protein [Pyrofollis japonicus]|uniref:ATP-binding cassette domain-containing protein n=1 Tax=Pyrofollis japonicus TaxID=3060460 RepID=UPI00295BCBE9|nr:ABC transporter ATP-binding protein [Pyrofollis japonicus]BEP17203.1 ABC transporter ATP-binding protein [Pyrofollis japonicus]